MSVKLSVDFTGLCALVHDKKSQRAEVILVDPDGGAQHYPALSANLRDVQAPQLAPPTRVIGISGFQTNGAVEQLGVWDLSGRLLRVQLGANARAAGAFNLFEAEGETKPGPARLPANTQDPLLWRDARFIADMQTIAGSGQIDPALTSLVGTGPRPHPRVAARVSLEGGSVESVIPSHEKYRGVVFDFHEAGGPLDRSAVASQPLTDTFRWVLTAEEQYVTVEVVDLKTLDVRRRITLPQRAEGYRFSISHLPRPSEAQGQAKTAHGAHSTHGATSPAKIAMHHFAAFYELLKVQPRAKVLPFEPLPNGAAGVRPVYCPPAAFTL